MAPLYPDTLSIQQIRRWSGALARLLEDHGPDVAVPSCADWTLADLCRHLTEVQLFWAHIIESRPAGPETWEAPTDVGDIAAGLRSAAEALVYHLGSADPDEQAWSWSDDQTVGFTIRRQIHEALVHYIDGVLAVDSPVPDLPARLAADGIDELVGVMLTGTPAWAEFTETGVSIEIRATDTGDRWRLQPGRMAGTEPSSGRHFVLAGYEISADPEPPASISGRAVDLLLWMWGRLGQEHIEASSATDVAGADLLRSTVADVTQ